MNVGFVFIKISIRDIEGNLIHINVLRDSKREEINWHFKMWHFNSECKIISVEH